MGAKVKNGLLLILFPFPFYLFMSALRQNEVSFVSKTLKNRSITSVCLLFQNGSDDEKNISTGYIV